MPDRIKVDQFNGLYTNVDESKLNPEYQSEAVNVRFRTGYVESEGYVSSLANLPANVIYQAPVVLDNDKLENGYNEFGELVNTYKQDLQEYLMIISLGEGKTKINFEQLNPIVPPDTSNKLLSPLAPVFYLNTPGNGSEITLPVFFSWSAVIGKNEIPPHRWGIQISTYPEHTFPLGIIYENADIPVDNSFPGNPAGSIVLSNPLTTGTRYYWRVYAITEDGDISQFSSIWNFTIIQGATIDPPYLISPVNNTVITEFPIKFDWESIDGSTKYLFQLSPSINFSEITLEAYSFENTLTLTNPFSFAPELTYFWRVMVFKGNNNSEWSEIWSFVTPEIILPPIVIPNFSKVYKHWNSNGIVLLLTNTGVYWVGKINRRYGNGIPSIQNKICVTKHIKYDFPINVNIELVTSLDPNTRVPITIENVLREYQDTYEGVKRTLYSFNALYPDGTILGSFKALELVEEDGDSELVFDMDVSQTFYQVSPTPNWTWGIHVGHFNIPGFPYLDSYTTLNRMQGNRVIGITFNDFANESIASPISFDDDTKFASTYLEVLVTYTINERDEYVVYTKLVSVLDASYFIKISGLFSTLNENLSTDNRISAISVYIRTDKKNDFEQIMFFPLLSKNRGIYADLYFNSQYPNGYYLSQTIGTVYSLTTYKPIDNFTDYIEIGGIAYGIFNQRVYFPAIGRGQILNGTFYDYIPEVEGDLLSDVNGTLGVFGTQLKLVIAQDSREGYLLFSIKDKMNFQIRDRYDLATSPEGIIIHTKRGIYVTNGYERKMISEEINNLIEANFETGNISYSPTDEMLFYTFKLGNEYYTFRYDFIYGKWSEIKPGIAGRLTFSESGIIHYLNESEGKVYKLDVSSNVYSIIRTPSVDLDYPFLGKNLIYIDVDFEGILDYENYSITNTRRLTTRLGIPVSKRIPNALIGARFIFKGKIYTIDIYYDAIGEFRHENHIPSPETISEGIQQYPDYLESITK